MVFFIYVILYKCNKDCNEVEELFRIAICDDEKVMIDYIYDKIKYLLDSLVGNYEVFTYESGETMLLAMTSECFEFDAVFLDIEMGKVTGLKIAEELYAQSEETSIIFVTNRDDLVYDAINYRPFSFIRKTRINDELEPVINRLIEKKLKKQEFFEFEVDNKIIKRLTRDIMYMESQGHYIILKCTDGIDYKIRGKIYEFEIEMHKYAFVRIHSGYLVNISHVQFVKYSGVSMDDGTTLPISRRKFEDIKNRHLEYVRTCVHGNN